MTKCSTGAEPVADAIAFDVTSAETDTQTTLSREAVRALCAFALDGARLETRDLETWLAIEDESLAGEVFAAAAEPARTEAPA